MKIQQHSVKKITQERATSSIMKNNYILFIKSIIWGAAVEKMVGFFIASQQVDVKQHVFSVNKPFYDCIKRKTISQSNLQKIYAYKKTFCLETMIFL